MLDFALSYATIATARNARVIGEPAAAAAAVEKMSDASGQKRDRIFFAHFQEGRECHGIQHFESVDFFGGNLGFEERCKRDNLKFKLCSEKGIKIYYFADIDCEYFEKIYCNEDLMIKEICRQK